MVLEVFFLFNTIKNAINEKNAEIINRQGNRELTPWYKLPDISDPMPIPNSKKINNVDMPLPIFFSGDKSMAQANRVGEFKP